MKGGGWYVCIWGIYMSGLQPSGFVARATQPFSTPASKLAGDPGFGLGWYVSGLRPLGAGRVRVVGAA
jgi:hypothetical protein